MHRRPFAVVASATLTALAAFGLAGCSAPSDTGADNQPSGDTTTYSFAFTTPPGQETHWCQYAKLPEGDGKGVSVTGYSWRWENMHHWSFYRTTADLPAD